jgi:hypothetical protein
MPNSSGEKLRHTITDAKMLCKKESLILIIKKGELKLKERLMDTLKNLNKDKTDKELSQAVAKIENQKRLSSQEFLKVHETIWQNGPPIKYQDPVAVEREKKLINQDPNLF